MKGGMSRLHSLIIEAFILFLLLLHIIKYIKFELANW
jgi:hypothetical protein